MENANERNTRLQENETQIKCEANEDLTDTTQTDTVPTNQTLIQYHQNKTDTPTKLANITNTTHTQPQRKN